MRNDPGRSSAGRALLDRTRAAAVLGGGRGSRGMALFERSHPGGSYPNRRSRIKCRRHGGGPPVVRDDDAGAQRRGAVRGCRAGLAARAGGVVMKRGTATVSAGELRYAISSSAIGRAAYGWVACSPARSWSRRSVPTAPPAAPSRSPTAASISLLHVGHVRYLQAAAREANRLVVAVNDDQSVAALTEPAAPR